MNKVADDSDSDDFDKSDSDDSDKADSDDSDKSDKSAEKDSDSEEEKENEEEVEEKDFEATPEEQDVQKQIVPKKMYRKTLLVDFLCNGSSLQLEWQKVVFSNHY